MEKRFGALSSSVDPDKLAATVTGIIRLLAGLAVALGVFTQVDMDTLIEQVAVAIPAGVAIYGVCETVFGLIRKVLIRFAEA